MLMVKMQTSKMKTGKMQMGESFKVRLKYKYVRNLPKLFLSCEPVPNNTSNGYFH